MLKTQHTDITTWLQALSYGIDSGEPLGQIFIKPYHLLTLAMELKRHECKHLEIPPELQDYAARMELWEAAAIEPPNGVHKASAKGKFLPVQALTSQAKVDTVADELTTIAATQSVAVDTLDSLGIALRELVGNYYSHAKVANNLFGLACAQSWPKGNLAQIAIVDGGIGIRNSLDENPALANQLQQYNACELATQYGITSKPGKGHSGYGLTLTKDLLELNGGSLILISYNEGFIMQHGTSHTFNLEQPWHGSLLVLEWNTNLPLDSKTVYENWPLPDGLDADDVNF